MAVQMYRETAGADGGQFSATGYRRLQLVGVLRNFGMPMLCVIVAGMSTSWYQYGFYDNSVETVMQNNIYDSTA